MGLCFIDLFLIPVNEGIFAENCFEVFWLWFQQGSQRAGYTNEFSKSLRSVFLFFKQPNGSIFASKNNLGSILIELQALYFS